MDPERDGPVAPLSLAAARALYRAPQAADLCWADVRLPDGSMRACDRPEATSLGLCPEHRLELFGLEVVAFGGQPGASPPRTPPSGTSPGSPGGG